MRFYLLSIALNVYTPCTHFLRIQGIIITNNERPGYAFIQSKLDVFPLANWIYIWGRAREREREKVGEKESKRRATNWSNAACYSFGLGLSGDATKLARNTTIPRRESCPASRWEQLLNARTARKERERERHRKRERDRERESKQERLNRLSCWATSTCLEAYRADRQATLSTGSGNSDWFHHWKYGLTTQVRTTYTRITCVL